MNPPSNQPFLDIYVIDKNNFDSLNINYKYKIKGDVNSFFHDGPLTLSKDGKTMYFSRTDFIKNSLGKDESGISNLKIYKASLIKNKWKNIEELPFNNNSFSNTHPALNEDDSKLYFSSDRPGGHGESDIYYVDIYEEGSFGAPINLGDKVNTKKEDNFPFVNNKGVLYFSSNGHEGFGILDIFSTVSNQDKTITNVINLGESINSGNDDFSFFMNKDGVTGYFASNRTNGVGSDDIYAFSRIKKVTLQGTIYNEIDNTVISDALLTLKNTQGEEIASFSSDSEGHYNINVNRDSEYIVTVTKNGYISSSTPINSKDIDETIDDIVADFSLQPMDSSAEAKNVSTIELTPIYFKLNSAKISEQYSHELTEIVDLMLNKYPEAKIKIASYCDSRGASNYNQLLSEKRAAASYKCLISKGIDANRIIEHKGFGEQNLLNQCDGSVNCTEKEHQINRRTNFSLIVKK
ncbi:OmpA family protein [Tamlana sp. I1]|uniref:OmpA family protein n=1 Tax=Tamlana sp. I1 TaxID=2762061 RepID=UPI00188FC6A5|nr:OmpA family protein [Tamlana sp. I1]